MLRGLARLVLGVFGVALGLLLALLLAGGALLWRLDQRPLDVTALAQGLEAHFAPGTSTGHLVLSLVESGHLHLLRLDAADVAHQGDSVQSATVMLPLRALLQLRLAPTSIDAAGVRLHITRDSPAGGRPFDLHRLDPLQHVGLTGLQLSVTDPALHGQWQVTDGAAELHREGGAVVGSGNATMSAGAVTAQLQASLHATDAGLHLDATSSAVSPAALAQALPALAAAAALDAPVKLAASVDFGPALQLQHAAVHAEAGPGTALLPAKGGTSPARFNALTLDADGTPDALSVHALRIVLQPPSGNPPSTLVLAGSGTRAAGRLHAQLTVDLDQAAFTDLAALWPERVGGGSRRWLVENVTAGTAHDGHFSFTVDGDAAGANLALTAAGGTLAADDVSIWWLRPVPPVEHARAVLTLTDPDTMLITATAGRTGNIAVKAGTMRITGLSGRDQSAVINADLASPLNELLALLAQPRLNLLSKRPFQATNPSGTVAAHLTVSLPLEDKVAVDQVAIHAAGKVADAHLGAVAAGRDLDHGQVALDVTNDGLHASGTALLSQLPAKLQLDMDFRDGPPAQVLQHAAAALDITPQAAAAAGLGVIGLQSGSAAATVDYAERRDATATLALAADLTAAALSTPIGWSKPLGAPAHAEGQALLSHGRVVGLQGIRATGPGLAITATSDAAGGRVTTVRISQGEVGRSSATGTIGLPENEREPYRVTLAGPRLDLEGQLPKTGARPPPDANPGVRGVPYAVDLRFEQVAFGPGQTVGPLALTATGSGQRLLQAHLTSRGPEGVEADLQPEPGARRLRATAADLGLLLRQTGLAHELERGRMTLSGAFDDRQPGSPFAGTLELDSFAVRGAPVTGKVLQALTVYGIADALRGPGLVFDRLVAPFRLAGSVLQVEEARAFSTSLGVTALGSFDFDHQTLDLTGTVVPAYALNSLPGRVPLVGRLFSPEKGSGMFAATYALHGPVADPAISFNPLSALTPGFTRGLFGLLP